MKRTHSNPVAKGRNPSIHSGSSSSSSSSAGSPTALSQADFTRLGEAPLPPFSAYVDFGDDQMLQRFAQEGVTALCGEDGRPDADKYRKLTVFCVQQDELRVLTWLLARTARASVDVSRAILRPADIERLMRWSRTLPIPIDLSFELTQLDEEDLDALLEGLHSNDNIRDLDLRYCVRCEFSLPNDIRKALQRVRDQRPIYGRICETLSSCKGLRELSISIDRRNIGCLAPLIRAGTLPALAIEPFEDGELGEEMALLADALSQTRGLTWLRILRCPLDAANAKRLFGALAMNGSLLHMSVIDCGLQGIAVQFLRDALQKNGSLLTLDISHNPIEEDGAKELAAGVGAHPFLSTLVMRRCELGTGIAALADAIASHPGLRSLDLANNPSLDGIKHLARALRANGSLQSLNLADSVYFIDREFVEAVERHPAMVSMDVRGIPLALDAMQALWRLHERKTAFDVKLELNKHVYPQPSEWERLRAAIADKISIKSEADGAEDSGSKTLYDE